MNEAHTFQRIAAYIIDIILISFLCTIVTIGLPQSEKAENAQKESNELIEKYTNKEINESEYIDKLYETKYTILKETILSSVISLVVTFGYFAAFAYYNKGQTLGKKLMHIKVVSKEEKEVSYLQMITRTMIFNGCLASLLSIILILFIKSNQYIYTIGALEFIQSALIMASAIMVICRKDKKGLHDLICGTKVVEC